MDKCYIGTAADECMNGLRNAEVGYRVDDIEHNFDDPRDYNNDTDGSPIGFHAGHKLNLSITVNGRVCGAAATITGLPFAFPCDGGTVTFANIISGYGITTGGVYLMNLRIREADEEDTSFTATLTRHPGIA